jgi:putative addiction module component (TIGR02574 family)
MQSTIEIKDLSREEKLRMMEALWESLLSDGMPLESPEWHKKELQETEDRLNKGQERILDWQEAKKELREYFK